MYIATQQCQVGGRGHNFHGTIVTAFDLVRVQRLASWRKEHAPTKEKASSDDYGVKLGGAHIKCPWER